MAPLTWRNVAAPNFGPAAALLNASTNGFTAGGAGLDAAFGGLGAIKQNNASAAALPILARVANEQGVNAAIAQVEGQVAPHNRSAELLEAMASLRGETLDFAGSRADTAATRGQEERAAAQRARAVAAGDQLNALAPEYLRRVEDATYGATSNISSPNTGGSLNGLAPDSLLSTESGGNFGAKNNAIGSGGRPGHFGRVQFGLDRLDDARRAGAIPADMTPEQFLNDENAQLQAEAWHFGDIQTRIDQEGLDQAIGQTVGDTPITRDGLVAMAHLGGFEGMKRFLETGGTYDPADANGTKLSDYARTHAGNTTGAPGAVPQGAPSPSGSGGPRLSDLVGPGNQIPVDKLLALAASGQTAANTQRGADDANDLRDFNFGNSVVDRGRSDAEFQRGEESRLLNEQAKDWVSANTGNLTRGLPAAIQSIEQNPDLSRKEKEAYKQATRAFLEGNADLFTPQTPVTGPVAQADAALQRALRDAGLDDQIGGILDQGPLAEATGAVSGAGQGGGAGGAGEGGGRFDASAPLPDAVRGAYDRLRSAGVNVTTSNVIDLLNGTMDRTGLSKEVILTAMGGSLESSFWNNVPFVGDSSVIDENRFAAKIAELAPAAIRQNEKQRQIRSDARGQIGLFQAEFKALRDEFQQNQALKPAGYEARNKEIATRLAEIPTEIGKINGQVEDSLDISTNNTRPTPGQSAAGGNQTPAETSVQRSARIEASIARAAGDGPNTPPTGLTEVNPNSSPAGQLVDTALRNSEINDELVTINNDLLRLSGGELVQRTVTGALEFFTPRTPQERAQLEQVQTAAQDAQDWFGTKEARKVFKDNPGLLAGAKADPINFYRRFQGLDEISLPGPTVSAPREFNGAPGSLLATRLPGDIN